MIVVLSVVAIHLVSCMRPQAEQPDVSFETSDEIEHTPRVLGMQIANGACKSGTHGRPGPVWKFMNLPLKVTKA